MSLCLKKKAIYLSLELLTFFFFLFPAQSKPRQFNLCFPFFLAVEFRTFGKIAGVSTLGGQWVSLTLGKPPSWSRDLPGQVRTVGSCNWRWATGKLKAKTSSWNFKSLWGECNVRSVKLLCEPRLLENMCLWVMGQGGRAHAHTRANTHAVAKTWLCFIKKGFSPGLCAHYLYLAN